MRIGGWVRLRVKRRCVEGQYIVCKQKHSDDNGLRDFDAVDTCKDVDAVGAEDGDGGHVGVVQPTDVDDGTQVRFEHDGDGNVRDAVVDKVDNEHGDRGEGRNEEFVTPSDIEQVVTYPEEDNRM